MGLFSTRKRLNIDGTEAWVVSAEHTGSLLDLVFRNRRGEIWLFNNDLKFFKRRSLFKSIYLHKIVRDLAAHVAAVKVIVDEANEEDVRNGDCAWLQERRADLEDFVKKHRIKTCPRFLFAPVTEIGDEAAIARLFGDSGIPPLHTWVFYLHGHELQWDRQHGMALFRPTEFPFGGRDSPLMLSWHLSDRSIMNTAQLDAFDDCFGDESPFEEILLGTAATSRRKRSGAQIEDDRSSEGLAFGEPVEFLVLTPADDEMSYFRKKFGERLHEMVTPGANNCYSLKTQRGKSVVFAKLGEGNIAATAATYHLLDIFRPQHVILVGVAGAVPDRGRHIWAIGDVAIGQNTIDYEWGTVEDEHTAASWSFRPKTDIDTTWGGERFDRVLYSRACSKANGDWKLTASEIKRELHLVARKRDLPALRAIVDKTLDRPAVAHQALIGSGSKVVASRKFIEEVIDRKSADINAFETEAAGVSYACCLHSDAKYDYLVVRGIMDLADGETRKSSVRKRLRHIAKIACGRFVTELLEDA